MLRSFSSAVSLGRSVSPSALASAYVAGIAVLFGTLGTVFGLLGKAFGAYLGNPFVVVPLAIFFVAMALSMFGAFELAELFGEHLRRDAVERGEQRVVPARAIQQKPEDHRLPSFADRGDGCLKGQGRTGV